MSPSVESMPPLPRRFQYGPSDACGFDDHRALILAVAIAVREPLRVEAGQQEPRLLEAEWLENVVAHEFVVRRAADLLDDRGENRIAGVRVLLARSRGERERPGHRRVEECLARQRLEVAAESDREAGACAARAARA